MKERHIWERKIVLIQPFTITVSDGKEKEVILRGELRGEAHIWDCVEVSGKEMQMELFQCALRAQHVDRCTDYDERDLA